MKIDIWDILLESYSLLMVSSQQQERQNKAAIQKYLPGMLFTLMNIVATFVGGFIKFLASVLYGA
jgi:hypothetical protein